MRYVSRIILLLAFVYTTSTHAQQKLAWQYLYTIDGDSLVFYWPEIPLEKKTIIIRLDGIDTPEKHSLCKEERNLAYRAADFVRGEMDKAKNIRILPLAWDKYGGRLLGRVELDGKDLAEKVLKAGLAREYHGEHKKGWC